MGVSQVICSSGSRPGVELETSGELFNNSDSWALSPDLLSDNCGCGAGICISTSFPDDFNANFGLGRSNFSVFEEKSRKQIFIRAFLQLPDICSCIHSLTHSFSQLMLSESAVPDAALWQRVASRIRWRVLP